MPGVCGSPQWKGDSYCDDENNNEGCNWDGGDCCGEDVDKAYCTECKCKDPKFAGGNGGGNGGGDNGGNNGGNGGNSSQTCGKY